MSTHSSFFKLYQSRFVSITTTLAISLVAGINIAIASPPKSEEPTPLLIREGDELIVPEKSPLRARLVVTPVIELDAPHIVHVPGVVEADPSYTVNILPPLTGRLMELKVDLGDSVKQGQILAIIDSPDLDQAYADVDKARDALDVAAKALARARNVHEAGGNSIREVELINSTYEQALAESKRAEARLSILLGSGGNIKGHVLSISAPIDGTITALNSGIGTYLTDPTATLMTISNLDRIWVTANIPENLLSSVAKGQLVGVDLFAYSSQQFKGRISFISTLLEPDTHRAKARVSFTNPDNRLKPNMYATVDIAVKQSKQIVVPLSALLMNNDSITVFVEVKPWTFVRRVVELGHEDDGYVRIVSGLSAGDRIVIRGGVLLND